MSESLPLFATGRAPRILIVRIGAMGDVLHALPAVAALRAALPAAHIGWAVDPRWQSLLAARTEQGSALVDTIHVVPVAAWKEKPFSRATRVSIQSLRRAFRANEYEMAVDLQGTIRSAAVGRMASARVFAGRTDPRESLARLLYTQSATPRQPHIVQQTCEILSAAVALPLTPAPLSLDANPTASLWATAQLAPFAGVPVAVLSAGGGWGAKCWPAERFGQLAAALASRGVSTIVAAATDDNPAARAVVEASSGATRLIACDLPKLTALLRRAQICIAGDTGPLHLAAALGTPVVALFGPTDPARNGPWTTRVRILRGPQSKTSYKHTNAPDPGLNSIRVEDVIHSAMELLLPDR